MLGFRRYAVDIGKVSVTWLSITLSDSFYGCEMPFLDYVDELLASEEFLFFVRSSCLCTSLSLDVRYPIRIIQGLCNTKHKTVDVINCSA